MYVVKQNQDKADLEDVHPSEGVCAGHAPHLSEPQGNLQGKWLSLNPFFFPSGPFAFHLLVSGKCYNFPYRAASPHQQKFGKNSKSPVLCRGGNNKPEGYCQRCPRASESAHCSTADFLPEKTDCRPSPCHRKQKCLLGDTKSNFSDFKILDFFTSKFPSAVSKS